MKKEVLYMDENEVIGKGETQRNPNDFGEEEENERN